jgi:hypothetical protein
MDILVHFFLSLSCNQAFSLQILNATDSGSKIASAFEISLLKGEKGSVEKSGEPGDFFSQQ